MEKYINNGVRDFIEAVEEESTCSLFQIGFTEPEAILNLFDENQLLITTNEPDSYTAYALLTSGKLLRFSYGYAKNGLLDIWVQMKENGDKFTVQKYEVGAQNIQISDEKGEIYEKPQASKGSIYNRLVENIPLKDLIVPVSVEQMKNRGILSLDKEETNPVIYKLIEYVNGSDKNRCVHMDSIGIEDSNIDDLFDDDQLISYDSDIENIRWAILNYCRILKITCLPVSSGYGYVFELSTGIHPGLVDDTSLYTVDEILDNNTGKTYFNVRRVHQFEKKYNNGTIISRKTIGGTIRHTDINQLIERSKEQFRK